MIITFTSVYENNEIITECQWAKSYQRIDWYIKNKFWFLGFKKSSNV